MLLIWVSSYASAQSGLNLSLPNAGSAYGSDTIRADGFECSNSIGGSTNFEFGVTGIISEDQDPFSSDFGSQTKDVGVYGRIIIPLDGPRERVNCNTLYQLELQKRRLEVQMLKEEIRQLRELQFEN